jgi:hypothetical protein
MKLRHWVAVGLLLVGGYVVIHWLFAHGGKANLAGSLGQFGASVGAGIG